jgi:hypothetical protein
MKPIYIYRPHTKSNKTIFAILVVLMLLVGIVIAAPFLIKSYINKTGADEKGYAYRIGDLDIGPFKAQVHIHDLKVFNIKSSAAFVEISDVKVRFNFLDLIKNEKRLKVNLTQMNFILSKDLFEEVNRIKNEKKEKNSGFYVDQIDAYIEEVNVKDLRQDLSRTILSLKDANLKMNDFGFGSVNEKTEFKLNSSIAEGGKLKLSGKTTLQANNTPWTIEGEMTGITSKVLEKMAGGKLPLEIKEANINTKISAASAGGQISGKFEPDVKEFKILDDKEQGFLKRNIAKATNLFLNKATKGDKKVKLEIPFTLNENFTFNFEDTIKN